MHLTDHIKSKTATNPFIGIILLDLQKAFDTVGHAILCGKLNVIGVKSIEWFKSYLSGRKQSVNVNSENSGLYDVTCGVPQGSLLGRLLFLIFLNDLSTSIDTQCKVLLYADNNFIPPSQSKHYRYELVFNDRKMS
jgi:hypothetical protein